MELTKYDMTYVPQFIKQPLPLVCIYGSVVSFACQVEPVDAEIVWSVCGREVSDKSRSYSVRIFGIFLKQFFFSSNIILHT